MKMKVFLVATISGLCVSMNSFAQDSGYYVGGSIGYVDLDQNEASFDSFIADAGQSGSSEIDGEDFNWKVFAGYRFHQNFALELGHVNLGEAVAEYMLDNSNLVNAGGNTELNGFNISGVASFPVHYKLDLFAKGGVFIWDADTESSILPASGTQIRHQSGEDLSFGLGAVYRFTDNVSLRAEWERYNDVESSDIDTINFGVQYHF